MVEPVASRPYMPGYGTLPPGEGTGLLPWTWALARLQESHDFWLATVWPDGRPHLSPVWAVWDDGALWFSASPRSRKMRNIRGRLPRSRCPRRTPRTRWCWTEPSSWSPSPTG